MRRIILALGATAAGLVVASTPASAADYTFSYTDARQAAPHAPVRLTAAVRQRIPLDVASSYGGRRACAVTSPHKRFRIWWSESARAAARMPDADGSCATRPYSVATLLPQVDGIASRERALGLPAAPSDLGQRAFGVSGPLIDGGTKAIDVYLIGSSRGGNGLTPCQAGLGRGRRFFANTWIELGAQAPTPSQALRFQLVQAFAHELVHTSQCHIHRRDGLPLLRVSGIWVAEGTAESLSTAALHDHVGDGSAENVLVGPLAKLAAASRNPPVQVLPTRWRRPPGDLTPYTAWGLWYGLQGGAHGRKIVKLYGAILAAGRTANRRQNVDVVYRQFGVRAVQSALRSFAATARVGGQLAALQVPAIYRGFTSTDVASPFAATPTATAPVTVGVRAFRYVRFTWPGGATHLTVSVRAKQPADAARVPRAVVLALPDGTRLVPAASGSDWTVDVTHPPEPAPGLGPEASVTLVLANGARSPLAVQVTATSS
jgi:hypothetical protein